MPTRLAALWLLILACNAAPAPALPRKPVPPSESLGQCLIRKGAHLYGASWCPPCHDQLKLFGNEADLIPFTDCDPTGLQDTFIEACTANGIPFGTMIPAWTFKDGSRLYGVRHPAVIAAVAGCPLP